VRRWPAVSIDSCAGGLYLGSKAELGPRQHGLWPGALKNFLAYILYVGLGRSPAQPNKILHLKTKCPGPAVLYPFEASRPAPPPPTPAGRQETETETRPLPAAVDSPQPTAGLRSPPLPPPTPSCLWPSRQLASSSARPVQDAGRSSRQQPAGNQPKSFPFVLPKS
jgi:hypothetical protein